jgi:hypothetical protein
MEIISLTENLEATITLRSWVSTEFRIPCDISRISAKSSIKSAAEFREILCIASKIPCFAGSQKIVSMDILLEFSSAENFVAAAGST